MVKAKRSLRTLKLTIAYDGTAYAGWQSQKNARAIQDVIEKALAKITAGSVALVASGRTDAGVHARAQVAHFRTRSSIPPRNLRLALNTALPDDIVVTGATETKHAFHAQKSAVGKRYRYTIVNNEIVDPFIRRYAMQYSLAPLSVSAMRRAARYLVGTHDFRSFRNKTKEAEKDSVRTVRAIEIRRSGDTITFDVEANGFLYNMVRNIVGTLVEVGRGKMRPSAVREVLARHDRRFSGPKVPAKGLCLMEVWYHPAKGDR